MPTETIVTYFSASAAIKVASRQSIIHVVQESLRGTHVSQWWQARFPQNLQWAAFYRALRDVQDNWFVIDWSTLVWGKLCAFRAYRYTKDEFHRQSTVPHCREFEYSEWQNWKIAPTLRKDNYVNIAFLPAALLLPSVGNRPLKTFSRSNRVDRNPEVCCRLLGMRQSTRQMI